MFLCYYVAWPCDLDLWLFDRPCVSYRPTVPLIHDPHTNFDYPTTTCYCVMNYWIWSHFRYHEQSLRMRRVIVTYHRGEGGKMVHILNSLTPIYLFTLTLSGATSLRRRLSMSLAKIVFIPLWRLHRSMRMRSITWAVPRGSPRTTRHNFWPWIVCSLYNFYGSTMAIKDHPRFKVDLGSEQMSSQNRSPKWLFFFLENLRV